MAYADPELWEAAKTAARERFGGHSARAMQFAGMLYRKAGGRYIGRKTKAQQSLSTWTRQDWTTKSGKRSRDTGERYLPRRVIEGLTASEYASTTRAKRAGMAKGEQYVKQPERIAKKVRTLKAEINPRPRKYASAAERQKALRERFPTLCVRVEQEQADFMKRIADEQGRTLQDVHLAFIKYANGRGNLWLTQGLKGFAPLPRFEETPKENPMKRKPTPAQIAARERFAEMARSGAFKRKAKRNPAKKTVSQKISQLTREGYPQKQAVAIALSEQRAGKVKRNPAPIKMKIRGSETPDNPEGIVVTEAGALRFAKQNMPADLKRAGFVASVVAGSRGWSINYGMKVPGHSSYQRNPRASNPIILVSDKPIVTKRKSNPAKPKRQRMLNISWLTAGGQREIMSVPIEFVFTHYVGNVAEKFFVRTENGQLIVSEYSTGGRIGQVPYTMRAAALNDRDAAKRYVGEMLSKIGAERFKAAVKKLDPIN